MKGFVLGVLLCALGFGGVLYWMKLRDAASARTATAVDAGAPAPAKPREKKKRRRGAARAPVVASASSGEPESWPASKRLATIPAPTREPEPEPEPEPVKLSAADLKLVAQGDDLSRPDVVRLDMSDNGGSRELTQDDIDAKFRAKEEAVLSCISRARPDEESYVPGRVTVKFRIQRGGNVRGVRVEAPAILQKGGLYGCIKGVVGGLRFPPSNGSQVVSYPFTLS